MYIHDINNLNVNNNETSFFNSITYMIITRVNIVSKKKEEY